MPQVLKASCPCCVTLSEPLPRTMSMMCPDPNAMPLACCTRNTVDSSLRAASVASQVSGGCRQLSQLPQYA